MGVGSAYLRLTEIAIFGEYNVPYYDYSVTSNKGDFINDSGNIYMGEEFDYVLPLVKSGYTFDHLEINGNTAECEIDPARNTVAFGFKLESDMNVVAVYNDDPTTLTPKKFKVKDGKVALPINSIAWEARQGFEEYPANIAIKDGDNIYKNGEWIKDGMKLVLFAGGEIAQELDIVPQYDYNDDGDANVTDIIAAVDGILGNEITEHGKFVFDGNCSDTLTVSDVVKARKDILTRADGTSDYTTRESNMKDFKFKSMGRTILGDDNSLFFENAASGILFNLDCYGDVVANINAKGSALTYYTLIIDGKTERIDPTRTSNAYLSYSVLTAKALDADWSNVSIGGGTMTDQRKNNRSWIPLVYKQNTLFSNNTEYTFPRKSDVLVVNLGTNDEQWLKKDFGDTAVDKHQEAFASALDDLIEYALEKNGRDMKIVFAFGLMSGPTGTTDDSYGTYAHNAYKAKVEALRADGIDAHYVRLTARRGGGNGHPSYLDDIEAAMELSNFIKENVLD